MVYGLVDTIAWFCFVSRLQKVEGGLPKEQKEVGDHLSRIFPINDRSHVQFIFYSQLLSLKVKGPLERNGKLLMHRTMVGVVQGVSDQWL